MNYNLPTFKHPTITTNIQSILHEHLPTEHNSLLGEIEAITGRLADLTAAKEYLEKVAEACEIRITVD
jgi:hypothetical protein